MESRSREKVSRIIEAYARGEHPVGTEEDFAGWLADPRHGEEKDEALAELWSSFPLGRTRDADSALLRMKMRLGHPLPLKRRIPRWIPAVAAVLLPIAIFLTVFLLTNRPAQPMVTLALQTADSMLYQLLPDNSELWLNSNSSLVYTEAADGSRHAKLRGEACFKVAHNGTAFEVEVPDLTVRVLGTEFNVKESADATEVVLYEGSVEALLPDRSVPLTPGTMLTYRGGEVSVGPIPADHINWRYAMLDFRGEDIASILEKVCRFHGAALEIAGTLPADPLSIRFDGRETIDYMMMLLQQLSAGFDYESDGDTIKVTPR